MNVAPADGTPKWNLTKNFKEEKMTVFLVLALLMGTGLIGVVIAVVKANAMVYVGITGVMSAAMWMPYLMALIYYGTDKGKPMSGLYKKLAYDPAIHRLMSTPGALPKWVKRAMVAHNNSLENFMLFATGVFFALSMQVPEADVRTPAMLYFCFRVYYWIFTVAPEIFMMKTAFWCMGWYVTSIPLNKPKKRIVSNLLLIHTLRSTGACVRGFSFLEL